MAHPDRSMRLKSTLSMCCVCPHSLFIFLNVRPTDCPSGSTEASLHIVATSRGSVYGDFHLFVVEPGGTEVIVSDVVGPPHCDRGVSTPQFPYGH